uniref:G-protein coupled receptors family 1 profile domain-containing protein n=1 Tax=Esox lucius TaxID=8010 RepID=A0AAY5JXI7_ESOLU
MYIFSLISVVTVFLNLLVIISISHIKQLHTPTNLLILSLAVSDLLVGLIVIPAITLAIMEQCWVLGDYYCALLIYITCLCTSISIAHLVLISVDRYVAVCNPLMYHSTITITRSYCCMSITCRCFEECYFVKGDIWINMLDLVISMVFPCSIIITLYLKIFVVARSQARQVYSKETVQANKSERKAAKTLGIVVFNYLICWLPINFTQYIYFSSGNSSSIFIFFLPLVNSFINPIIYAFFYPWFKATAKRILTLNIRHV